MMKIIEENPDIPWDLEAHKNQLCYDKSETHKPKITCMKFLTEDEESDIYKDITLENVLLNTDHPWDYSKMKFESGDVWYKYRVQVLKKNLLLYLQNTIYLRK